MLPAGEGGLLLSKGLDLGRCGEATKACLALGLSSLLLFHVATSDTASADLEHATGDCMSLGS